MILYFINIGMINEMMDTNLIVSKWYDNQYICYYFFNVHDI